MLMQCTISFIYKGKAQKLYAEDARLVPTPSDELMKKITEELIANYIKKDGGMISDVCNIHVDYDRPYSWKRLDSVD